MRSFKCLGLSLGHIIVGLSLAFVDVSDQTLQNEQQHFLKWFGMTMATGFAATVCVAYIVAMPLTQFLKIKPFRAYLVAAFMSLVYFVFLGVFLWSLQHVLIQPTVVQTYSVCAQIGLIFGMLVLYDSMRGQSTKELYERVMDELDEELEMGTLTVGEPDTDVQRT